MLTLIIICFVFYAARFLARALYFALLERFLRVKHRALHWRQAATYERFDGRIWRPV